MGCNPAVSVIIPCYNRENLIGEAIESALNQGPDVEVIVVDDGSEDASWTTIQSFSQVRSFRQSNAGPSAARNFGLRQASGNYIKFLDSDDLLVEGAIAALQQAQRSLGPRQIAFGLAAVFGSQNGQERTYGYADLGAGPIAGGSLLYGTMPSWLPLYPRDALLDAGDFNEQLRISEDYELAVRLHLKGYQFIQFMVLVVQVREHVSHRLSREYGAFGFQQHLRAFELSREHLKHATHNADYSAELRALARHAWSRGRNAAREGLKPEADRLFAFASSLAGNDAHVGDAAMLMLYKFFRPYKTERIATLLKSICSSEF